MNNGGQFVYTVEEAAKFLRLGRTSVYELIRGGELESIKVGSLRRITAAQLERFLERKEQEARR